VLHALGRVIARHARWFLVAWFLITAVGFAAVGGVFGNEPLFDRLKADEGLAVPGEAQTGMDLRAAVRTAGPTVQLLLDHVDPADSRVRASVLQAASEVSRVPHVLGVQHPYADQNGRPLPAQALAAALARSPLVSIDRRAVLVVVQIEGGLGKAAQKAAVGTADSRLTQVATELSRELPGSTGLVGGTQALIEEIQGHVKSDLKVGEAVALPLSLVVMVLVFGGLLAAGLPIAGAIVSIAGGLLSLLGFSHLMDLSSTVPSVVSVMGLGLCIDYGLLLVSRYREELRRLHDSGEDSPSQQALDGALERTLGTAGRTVAFSAVTVAISVSGLMFFQATFLRAVGAAGVSVVVVALLVALTMVPAMLAVSGDRLIRPGITHRIWGLRRFARRMGDVAPEDGAFSRLARAMQRRAALVVVVVAAFLLAAGTPVLTMRLVSSGFKLLPTSSTQRQLFEAVLDRFPAVNDAPVQVVTKASTAQLAAWGKDVVPGLPGVGSVDAVRELGTGENRVAVLGIRSVADQRGPEAEQLARTVAAHRPGFSVWVSGIAAENAEFLDSIRGRAPLAGALVVLVTFVLLFLMTGSILVPLKALVMNIVSLGASFGVLVWVFQQGHLESVLHFSSAGGIDTAIPAIVLAFAFGLSMDYEVFLLSRIKELRDVGASNDEAVVTGLQRSGRIITSAALIVVIVFAGFAAGQLLVIKQMGVALAVAVAVDATLVRMLLVPATMTLLGEWNWWAPGPLRRLYERFGVREE
jgi:RND superfamily putative drug exporter